jgi:hypothetical protein
MTSASRSTRRRVFGARASRRDDGNFGAQRRAATPGQRRSRRSPRPTTAGTGRGSIRCSRTPVTRTLAIQSGIGRATRDLMAGSYQNDVARQTRQSILGRARSSEPRRDGSVVAVDGAGRTPHRLAEQRRMMRSLGDRRRRGSRRGHAVVGGAILEHPVVRTRRSAAGRSRPARRCPPRDRPGRPARAQDERRKVRRWAPPLEAARVGRRGRRAGAPAPCRRAERGRRVTLARPLRSRPTGARTLGFGCTIEEVDAVVSAAPRPDGPVTLERRPEVLATMRS